MGEFKLRHPLDAEIWPRVAAYFCGVGAYPASEVQVHKSLYSAENKQVKRFSF